LTLTNSDPAAKKRQGRSMALEMPMRTQDATSGVTGPRKKPPLEEWTRLVP
jgi:hypothetical protein